MHCDEYVASLARTAKLSVVQPSPSNDATVYGKALNRLSSLDPQAVEPPNDRTTFLDLVVVVLDTDDDHNDPEDEDIDEDEGEDAVGE